MRFRSWLALLGTTDRTTTDFRNQPYVCGAIGTLDDSCLDRLLRDAPASVREVHRSPTAVLFASGEPEHWQADVHHGFLWNAWAEGDAPASWRDAAERRVAAGLTVADRDATLHTDAIGIQDVYTRRIGDAVYFSIRIDPLLRISDAPLHTDWSAWASIFALTAPVGDATPFAEIRRMPAASAWTTDGSRLRQTSFEPGWMSSEPDGAASPADAVATVEACMPADDVVITLSGGWDSRLLAILAARRSNDVVAWTTSQDDGRDIDLELATPVAEILGLKHRTLVPGAEAWLDELAPVRRRIDYQSTHHVWFMPLARKLHDQPEVVLDGLAGDVLFKTSFVEKQVATADRPTEPHQLLWNGLAQNRLRDRSRLASGVAAEFEARSRAAFADTVAPFTGHPCFTSLGVLHTRTVRAIGLSPVRLLAPEARVGLPFVHPDVIDAGMRVSTAEQMDGAFYRAMLAAADSRVARLPSTNDGGPKAKRGTQRQATPPPLRAMAKTIRSSDTVVGLLSPEFREALHDDRALQRLGGNVGSHRLLNWASLFAEWRATYADLLADDDALA